MLHDLVTGAAYVAQMTGNDADCDARMAFQSLASKLVPVAGKILDFGAGPGIDARMYAEQGFTVATYDVDVHMCRYLREYCRSFIATRRVLAGGGAYADFLRNDSVAGVAGFDLITANFAPLNLVGELPALFEKFHSLTAPGGKVLASVLSPYFVGDMRYGWWWRNALRLVRHGQYCVPGSQALIHRRRVDQFAAQCARHFALRGVFRGAIPLTRGCDGVLRLSTRRFMFLLFERRP
jgi:SAM-dependent methyltransferase